MRRYYIDDAKIPISSGAHCSPLQMYPDDVSASAGTVIWAERYPATKAICYQINQSSTFGLAGG